MIKFSLAMQMSGCQRSAVSVWSLQINQFNHQNDRNSGEKKKVDY